MARDQLHIQCSIAALGLVTKTQLPETSVPTPPTLWLMLERVQRVLALVAVAVGLTCLLQHAKLTLAKAGWCSTPKGRYNFAATILETERPC